MENDNFDTLAYETLETLKEYLPSLLDGIAQTTDLLASQKEEQAYRLLPQIFEGISWSLEVIRLTKVKWNGYLDQFDEEDLLGVFRELEQAMENQDTVLIADLLQYEIVPVFRDLQSVVQKIFAQ